MELPRLNQLYKKYKDQGLEIIAIEIDRLRDLAQKFIKEKELSFILLEELEGAALTRNHFQAGPFPYTYVIDDEGKILYLHGSFSDGDEWKFEEEIKLLLSK